MIKVALIFLFLAVVVVIILAVRSPHPTNNNLLTNVLGQSISLPNSIQRLLPGQGSPTDTSLVDQAKNSLAEDPNKTTSDLKELVYQKAQDTLDQAFGQTASQGNSVQVVENPNISPAQPLSTIDLSKSSDIKINLSKGSKYFLKFQNVPANSCLYINGAKYQILSGNIVEVNFSSSGTYPMKLNSCDLNDKSIGEMVVQ